MKYWWCLFSLLFASGCHGETAGLQSSQFNCGIPIIDPSMTLRKKIDAGTPTF
jgi:hypothetical protein